MTGRSPHFPCRKYIISPSAFHSPVSRFMSVFEFMANEHVGLLHSSAYEINNDVTIIPRLSLTQSLYYYYFVSPPLHGCRQRPG